MERQNPKQDPMILLRHTEEIELPELVDARIEATLQSIRSGDVDNEMNPNSPLFKRKKERLSRLRRISLIAIASVLLIGGGLTGIGFVSPSFAKAMQSVPILGSLFAIYGDRGMQTAEEQGFVQSSAITETIGDYTVSIKNIVFDGSRIGLEIVREGEGPLYNNGDLNHPEKGMIEEVTALYGQAYLYPAYKGAGDGAVLVNIESKAGTPLPDKFELLLKIDLEGAERAFEFKVPVESNTPKTVIEKPTIPPELFERGILIDRIILTPVTTQILVRLRPKAEDLEGTFVHADDYDLFPSIHDDLDREYAFLSGMGEPESPESEEGSSGYYQFEPIDSKAKSLKLQFAVPGEQNGKPYTVIEVDIPLPADRS